jgi:hypothetical protein
MTELELLERLTVIRNACSDPVTRVELARLQRDRWGVQEKGENN